MEDRYYTLFVAIRRIAESYEVTLSHRDPGSQAEVAPVRGPAAFDPAQLLPLQNDPTAYGRRLAEQLFGAEAIQQRFAKVETAAETADAFLRVLIKLDPSAQELQSLRWELLCHPERGTPLGSSEKVLLSRFIVSSDWRPVRLRARTELDVLIAVAAPDHGKLERMRLAPVDFEGESSRIREALGDIRSRTIGGPGSPLTLNRLLDALREEVDVLYLVAHGMFGRSSSTPALVLEDEQGEADVVKGDDLAIRLGELQRGPRLVVLVSCQSAGDGAAVEGPHRATVQATLAGRLADAGVPGVIAMQGRISMTSIETMMPTLFTELRRDGQIDRALAVARGKVRERSDWWMPALYSRLTAGRLWYSPGFHGNKDEEVWRRLLPSVRRGKVVPIIGPRLLEAAHGDAHETALRLAGASKFPLARHEWDDLPRVTQYMSVKEARFNALEAYKEQLKNDLIEAHREWLPAKAVQDPKLGKLLMLVGDRLRENDHDAYRTLAGLPASVYVTTNFDPLLERALAANDRKPQQVLSRWRYRSKPAGADEQPIPEEPSAKTPVVYHVFGAFGSKSDKDLVLTEDDYFDYLIDTAAGQLMPDTVGSALVDSSLLFLGFRLTDWHFRVLFRLMMSLGGKERLKDYCHVAVQLDPDMQRMSDVDGAKAYLAAYFGKEANIDVYWGSSEDFLAALGGALQAEGDAAEEEPEASDDDEWDFLS